MIKKIFAVMTVLFLVGCNFLTPQPQEDVAVDNGLIFETPKEWGKLVWRKMYAGDRIGVLDYDLPLIQSGSELFFENQVRVLYQDGIDKLFFTKKIDSGSCEDMFKKYDLKGGPGSGCDNYDLTKGIYETNVYEDGFYDTKSLKVTKLGINAENHAPILFLTKYGTYSLFSPKGKVFMIGGAYETCGASLISVETGEKISDYVECDALLTFSPNENVIASQSRRVGLGNGRDSFYIVIGKENIDLAKMLLLTSDAQIDDEDSDLFKLDFKKIIKVDSVTDEGVITFEVKEEAKDWLKTGKFTFDFASKELKQL
ncbi:MAG: hypothetical protein WC269_06680 [Candidatus Gracilibacteria bacterium]|jgi:hypothetical protein